MNELTFKGCDRIKAVAWLASYVDTLKDDQEYIIEVKEKKPLRSLDANALAWVLMDKLAEKLLKKALKKNSRSPELRAIYATLLLRQNRLDEAKKMEEDLHGTKYGSVYSEVILKQAMQGEPADYYKDPKYYAIYYDAYRGSLNPIWIRNCAIFNLKDGRFDSASALLPGSFADADDAYADRDKSVLEHRLWSVGRRSGARCRRNADHAVVGKEHGLSVESDGRSG